MIRILAALPFIVIAFLAGAGEAQACSACLTQDGGDTRTAFIVTTAFMSLLPLAMMGGFVWWLRRRFLRLRAEAEGNAMGVSGPRAPADRHAA